MSGQQSWQCQGRQQHGWFGSGTCASHGAIGSDDGRFLRIVFGVIGNLPAASRSRWDGRLSRGLPGRTANVLSQLSDASGLDAGRFAVLLPDTVGSVAAGRIQAAARAAAAARTPDDERAAGVALAGAVQAVGFDNWSRFVSVVEEHHAKDQTGPGAPEGTLLAGGYTDPAAACLALGMDKGTFSRNLHAVKRHAGLRGDDDIIILVPGGDVMHNGECIGNVHDG
jgi:hypothetical protein